MWRLTCLLLLASSAGAMATVPRPGQGGLLPRPGSTRRVAHPELDSRLLRRLSFGWVDPLLERGSKDALLDEDLIPLAPCDQAEQCHGTFDRAWAETSSSRDEDQPGAHVLRALWRGFGRQFAMTGLLKLLNDCLQFAGPMLLRATVKLIQSPERQAADGAKLVLALFTSSALQAVLLRHYFFINFRVGVRVNSALMAAVYAKTLRLSSGYLANVSSGELSNLLTSDSQRIADLLGYLHALWFAPLQVVVALWFLWREIGVSSLAGLLMIVVVLAANSWLARITFSLNKALQATADERLRLTAEVFGSIKLVKMNVWEAPFAARLRAVRAREVAQMRTLSALRALLNMLFTIAPTLVAASMLLCYTWLGFVLEVPSALAVLALVNMLRTPMLFLPIVSNNALDAVLAARRLANHLGAPEHSPLGDGSLDGVGLRLRDAHFAWPSVLDAPAADPAAAAAAAAADGGPRGADGARGGEAAGGAAARGRRGGGGALALSGLDLEARSGDFIAVVGPVGGGKSALLASLLGELTLTEGSAALRGSVALCPQNPFIARGTIRDNVMFGRPYDEARFAKVLAACALDVDVRSWPAGVDTELGDRGINLSGGQKARIALARACYSDADIYLLDDPLAAVDSNVSRHLAQHVLGPDGLLARKLRVVVTHELGAVGKASLVLAVDGGRIVERGPPAELAARAGGLYARLLQAAASDPMATRAGAGAGAGAAAAATAGARASAQAAPAQARQAGAEAMPAGAAHGGPPGVGEGGAGEAEGGGDSAHAQSHAQSLALAQQVAAEAPADRAPDLAELGITYDPDLEDEVEHVNAAAAAKAAAARGSVGTAAGAGAVAGGTEEQPRSPSGAPAASAHVPRGAAIGSSLTAPEDATSGRVGLRLYGVWLRAAGGANVAILFLLVFACAEGLTVATNWRLTHLADASSAVAGLRAYCLFGLASAALIFGRQVLSLGAGLRAGSVLHEQLVRRLMRAPLAWFDANPLGRLVNRLSKEQRVLDLQLPSTISQYAQTILICASTCALICFTSPPAILPLFLAAFAYARLQARYVSTATSLRRLEGAARSPVLSSALEAIEGAPSIRLYGAAHAAAHGQQRMLDALGRAVYAMIATNSWLGLRLELVGSFIVALAALGATVLPSARAGASAGTSGLALASALQLTQVLNWNVRTACELESQMISVERVHDAAVGAVEAPAFLPAGAEGALAASEGGWPSAGALSVSQLSASYRSGDEPVLRGVSFALEGGQKLAVVGRTGSGKSTLLLCLLRLVEPTGGAIAIDGVDVSRLGLHRLRAAVGVVPQEQATFSGTLRDNLDPNGMQSDEALRAVLAATKLDHLAPLLDSPLGPGSSRAAATAGSDGPAQLKLSVGQKQLVSIARALLPPRRRLVLMDEPTSSIDAGTDALIQRLFAEHFSNTTTVTVTHRLRTIQRADRVLVLEKGEVVEFGSPAELLQKPESALSALVRSGAIERQ